MGFLNRNVMWAKITTEGNASLLTHTYMRARAYTHSQTQTHTHTHTHTHTGTKMSMQGSEISSQ
jgi:hypothetical protein